MDSGCGNMELFKTPVRFLIAAASMSGKSTFMIQIIKNADKLFTGPINQIVWATGNKDYIPKELEAMPKVTVVEGIPNVESLQPHSFIVLDDLQMDNLKDICKLFTVTSHHRNISTFFLVQNLYWTSPLFRTISLNASHIVLFKSIRDKNQIVHLARQVFPEFTKSFMEVYKQATNEPYSYLIIDLSQTCSPIL